MMTLAPHTAGLYDSVSERASGSVAILAAQLPLPIYADIRHPDDSTLPLPIYADIRHPDDSTLPIYADIRHPDDSTLLKVKERFTDEEGNIPFIAKVRGAQCAAFGVRGADHVYVIPIHSEC